MKSDQQFKQQLREQMKARATKQDCLAFLFQQLDQLPTGYRDGDAICGSVPTPRHWAIQELLEELDPAFRNWRS